MTAELADHDCIICQKPFFPYPMGEKNGCILHSCKNCGSVMTEPLVTRDELDAYFASIDPQITHVPDPAREIIDMKDRIVKITPELKGKRFLDVAARQGYAIKAAHLQGMKVFGIDSHDFFIRFAQEKYPPDLFKHSTVMDYAAEDPEKYDIVFALETFCEQPDPDAFVAGLSRLMKKGGLLYIEEVDGNSFNLPRNFANWTYVDPPLNFIYMSKKGMEAILNRHGFQIQKMFFTWRPLMRLIAVKQ
ncbi:MAG TPA: class I SAM-dependent methyltransferase [Patescibacteria group bacterium]|nr:class I SAM-dependent methyltransferase [Patescibacteria group bacterium]